MLTKIVEALAKYQTEYGALPAYIILNTHAYLLFKRNLPSDILRDGAPSDVAVYQGIPLVVSAQTRTLLELVGSAESLRSMAWGTEVFR